MTFAPGIDLVRDRLARRRRWRVVVAVVGLVFGLQVGWAALRLQQIDADRAALQKPQRTWPVRGTWTTDHVRLATAAQAMLGALAVPWDGLLKAVESACPASVWVEAIQPNPKTGHVSIRVRTRDFADLAELVHRLSRQSILSEVTLASEALSDQGDVLYAVVQARWRPAQ